jgi:hypothetical protein
MIDVYLDNLRSLVNNAVIKHSLEFVGTEARRRNDL